MGAQVVISLVNTFFTGLFVLSLSLFGAPMPYSFVIIVVTFLCGLLPIVGNLISNTIIFCIGLTQSVQLGVISLSYLIILHKFEYFLNSKIIGGRIKNPMWLTLLSLLVGERLAGIPGMILAPVILNLRAPAWEFNHPLEKRRNYLKCRGKSLPISKPGEGSPQDFLKIVKTFTRHPHHTKYVSRQRIRGRGVLLRSTRRTYSGWF
jgi:predicted PurR-regulated permease PerM